MAKKKTIISYDNLSPELQMAFKQRYPNGYHNEMIKVELPSGTSYYAVTLDTDDAVYLVKVNVKIDTKIKDEKEEKDFFSSLSNNDDEGAADDDDDEKDDDGMGGLRTTSIDDLTDEI